MRNTCSVTDLRAEGLVCPLGIEVHSPRLSWNVDALESKSSLVSMPRAEIRSAISHDGLSHGEFVWRAGPLECREPWVDWGGPLLGNRQRIYWQIRLWIDDQPCSPWSDVAWFETGISEERNGWLAEWVDAPGISSPLFRCEFSFDSKGQPLSRARLYCGAGGFFEATLNTTRLGDSVLFPLHTDYAKQVGYATFDVGELLRQGTNVIHLELGGGWYERFGYGRRCFRCQLEIEFADGSLQYVGTKALEWLAADGPCRREDIYDGEWFDNRFSRMCREIPFDIQDWVRCGRGYDRQLPAEAPGGKMVGVISPPITVHRTHVPASIERVNQQRILVDAGENVAGWVRIRGAGLNGDPLRIRYGELRTDDGGVNQITYHGAAGEDRYTFSGTGTEVWEPRFTLHGFRFVTIDGPGEVLDGLQVEIRRVGNNLERMAHFSCADERLRELFALSQLTIEDNLQGVLTDCPQRDERQGWLGDAYGISPTVLLLYDAVPLYRKWLRDMDATQDLQSGKRTSSTAPTCPVFAGTIPRMRSRHRIDSIPSSEHMTDPVYTAACTFVPWQTYRASGDIRILERAFPMIMAHLATHEHDPSWPLASPGRHGDHAERVDCRQIHQPTGKDLVAAAIRIDEFRTASLMAHVLRVSDSCQYLADKLAVIRAAFRKRFFDEERGTYGTQTANALALTVLENEPREHRRIAAALCADIEDHQFHLTPGIIGMRYLLEALGAIGRRDLAFRGIVVPDEPGWVWMINAGLTTLHEHRVSTWANTSQNHPAHGLVSEWMLRWLIGIRFDLEPAGRNAIIDPGIELPVSSAEASIETVYGAWLLRYSRQDRATSIELQVPPGCTAQVSQRLVPKRNEPRLFHGSHTLKVESLQSA